MTEETDLATMMDGARLAGMLPYMQEQFLKQEEAIITRMGAMLTDGKLTETASLTAWIELLTTRRMRRRLEARVRMGVSAGNRQSTLLSLDPPLPI